MKIHFTYELLDEVYRDISRRVQTLLRERARQARYHAFKFFALGDCPHCRKIALEQMWRESPEKLTKDVDFPFVIKE